MSIRLKNKSKQKYNYIWSFDISVRLTSEMMATPL